MADTKTAELELLITLALVVMRMAPPDDQKDIDRALDDLHVASIGAEDDQP